jgi:membrane protein DedA with SNARE-associated domain
VQHFIVTYGYLAVFLLMLAESACVPIPSEVVMLFGGAMAAGGVASGSHPSLIGIIAAGVAGNMAGSYLAWWAGRHWGQAAVRSFGHRVHIHERDIDRAAGWFERYGPVAVLLGRVVPVVRTFISLPAGFADMPALRFGIYTTLGCLPWTAGLGVAGYQLGKHWSSVANAFHSITYVVIALLVLCIGVIVLVRMRRRRRAAPQDDYQDYQGYQDYPSSPDYRYAPAHQQPAYPSHYEPGYPEGPSPAERFWSQQWDEPQPANDRAVRPRQVDYQHYFPQSPANGYPAQPASQPTARPSARPAARPAARPPQPQRRTGHRPDPTRPNQMGPGQTGPGQGGPGQIGPGDPWGRSM